MIPASRDRAGLTSQIHNISCSFLKSRRKTIVRAVLMNLDTIILKNSCGNSPEKIGKKIFRR
jgi:hypothetical protein